MESLSNFLNSLLVANSGSVGIMQLLVAVAAAYLGGVLSSLTPCVYPMIPITMSVVGGIQGHPATARQRPPWSEIVARSIAYVLGMTLIYSFLGVAAGLTGRVFGTLTNTPGWYLGLGIVITFAALIMLDIIPFDPLMMYERFKRRFLHRSGPPPSELAQREMTWLGAFTLGASSGFIAAPCTTPVLTSILAYIAKSQSVGLGLALMTAFSLGLGTLLLLIAGFTGAIQILPRSGKWMKAVKVLSGLLLLAFAQYLIYRAGIMGGI